MSSLDERRSMNSIKWWNCHGENGVYLQNHLYSITSGKLFSNRKELEHLCFHPFYEVQQVRIAKG
jgi:hypothetical protein